MLDRGGLKRSWVLLLTVLLALSFSVAHADAPALPHRAWLPGFGGSCDGGPLSCTRIDELAFHARADAVFSSSTDSRGFAFVAPYGFSLALFDRLEGGIFSHTAVWNQPATGSDDVRWHQGPLRFALKALLWPWLSDPHHHMAIAASFEQEARLWRFDGPNQLGLLTDLATLRLSLNKPLGHAEVGLQVGALFDWQKRFATAELGARIGFHLPFLPGVKVFADGGVHGKSRLTYVNADAMLPGALDQRNPISFGGVLSFGVVARPRKQIDLAMAVAVGFGDVAPFTLTLRGPFDFSIGKGYSYPQSLVVDILRDTGEWVAEQLRKLPEPVRETCVLFARDGQTIATLGTLTDDGEHCELQGQRYRIGDKLYPDSPNRRVCVDANATRCVTVHQVGMTGQSQRTSATAANDVDEGRPTSHLTIGALLSGRRLDPETLAHIARTQGALGMVQGRLDDHCILNEGSYQVSPIGQRSTDGKHCVINREVKDRRTGKTVRTEQQEIQVGQPVFRDPATGRICIKANAKSKHDCPVAIDPEHNRAMTLGERAGYHGAIGLVDKADSYVSTARRGVAALSEPAELSTAAIKAGERAANAAKGAVETLRDPAKAKEAARSAWHTAIDNAEGSLQAAQGWWRKPLEKKLDDAAEAGGGGLVDLPVNVATGAAIGSVLRAGEATLEVTEDLRKVERAAINGKKAAQLAEKTELGASASAKGGTYVLRDPETGQVMRTGRTKDHKRRANEHKQQPETKQLDYERATRTDDYSIQRGQEQLLHDEYKPPLDKIRPISPQNPRRDEYLDAARTHNRNR